MSESGFPINKTNNYDLVLMSNYLLNSLVVINEFNIITGIAIFFNLSPLVPKELKTFKKILCLGFRLKTCTPEDNNIPFKFNVVLKTASPL